jgi:NAD(P)-dependent dehydrogenase (short-subunit alcohol dehydrogenase family)
MTRTRRVALVTGGSSGLGLAIATGLAGAGWRTYGASRRAPVAAGGAFEQIAMDVDDDASVEAGVRMVVQREGRLDAVVANAGFGIAGALEDTTTEEAKRQFETNFFGVHRLCRAALPHLRAQRRAHVVVIGSLAGIVGIPFEGMYSATKFALEGYCAALRIELKRTGVRVAIVEPGDFATPFTAARRMVAARGPGSAYDEATGADPADVAKAVLTVVQTARPALRHPVGAEDQVALASAKAHVPAEKLEKQIAAHFEV